MSSESSDIVFDDEPDGIEARYSRRITLRMDARDIRFLEGYAYATGETVSSVIRNALAAFIVERIHDAHIPSGKCCPDGCEEAAT